MIASLSTAVRPEAESIASSSALPAPAVGTLPVTVSAALVEVTSIAPKPPFLRGSAFMASASQSAESAVATTCRRLSTLSPPKRSAAADSMSFFSPESLTGPSSVRLPWATCARSTPAAVGGSVVVGGLFLPSSCVTIASTMRTIRAAAPLPRMRWAVIWETLPHGVMDKQPAGRLTGVAELR